MRYRVNDYKLEIDEGTVYVYLKLPDYLKAGGVIDYYLCTKLVPLAVRLVIDETQRIVFSSSMNKNIDEYVFRNQSIDSDFGEGYDDYDFYLAFVIPEGRTVTTSDDFTIEFDWGEEPSSLAKQGTDPTVTLMGVMQAMTPIANEYTQGKQAIVNALQSYGVECSMDETLSELAGKINQTGLSVEGVVFSNPQDNKLVNLLLTPSLVTSIKSSKQFTIGDYGPLYPFSGLRRIELSGVTTIGPAGFLSRKFTCMGVVQVLIFQNLTFIHNGDGTGFGNNVKIFDFGYVTARSGLYAIISLSSGNRTLRHWKSGGWFPVGYGDTINYATCLYDVSFRNVLQSSKDCSTWRPTEAMGQGTLLLEKDEWDDPNEPTETFTCNKDKFKWYFENHFLPCFADLVAEGSSATPTLTLYTTVYNFANTEYTAADPTKTYIDVLTDRGWTVASAS